MVLKCDSHSKSPTSGRRSSAMRTSSVSRVEKKGAPFLTIRLFVELVVPVVSSGNGIDLGGIDLTKSSEELRQVLMIYMTVRNA